MYNEILKEIVTAASKGELLYLQEEDSVQLVYAGLAEVNASITNDMGAIATRPTEKGKEVVEAFDEFKETEEEVAETSDETFNDNAKDKIVVTGTTKVVGKPSGYEIESGIPVPAGKRGTKRGCRYPFDKLEEVGQSFHVAPSEKTPNPAKSLASTVSGANKRMTPIKFVVRAVDETDPKSTGARVFRVE